MSEQTVALLVAAGKAERFGGDIPKPYAPIGDEHLMRRTAKVFLQCPGVDGVRIVIRREHHGLYKKAMEGLTLYPCVVGGDSRQESVRLGLESLAHRPPKQVLIHDIARPMASQKLILRVISALGDHQAAIPAMAITDTVKRAQNGLIAETIDREQLFSVQTPQGFHYEALLNAHRKFQGRALTDDAALFEQSGIPVKLVEGDADNFKITTEKDLERMQTLLASQLETRIGFGYDVHTLKPHEADTPVSMQHIKLCGVKIPFTHYLLGHSDADVGLHAMVDAMLGAMSAGDIGMHFPPDDRKWQGADSERFLLYAYELLKSRGGELVHADITLVCERPKIADYREQMIRHIAQLLKLAHDRISVKATTSEKLGFTGRSEGIAAHAVATVRLPKSKLGFSGAAK